MVRGIGGRLAAVDEALHGEFKEYDRENVQHEEYCTEGEPADAWGGWE